MIVRTNPWPNGKPGSDTYRRNTLRSAGRYVDEAPRAVCIRRRKGCREVRIER